ncbi:MAG TPA: type II secretion system F family protein, partial [Phycisphaerae bacterium]|nr:type II secretion system F family protein [Phycisphaerae bacterium]
MPVFEYKAFDLDSSAVAGTVAADTPRQARDLLRERGLTVTGIQPSRSRQAGALWRNRSGKRGQTEVTAFVRELATLLKAGIPLLSALQTLESQHSRSFRPALQDLADQVAAGSGLAEAMGRHPDRFDELCVSIVSVGENTGGLETALKRLAEFKEKAHRLRSRVTTALLYPAVVCLVGLAVTAFLMTYVVPNLLGTLTEAGKDLPAVTRVVKAASDLLVGWWWAILLVAVALAALVRALVATEKGKFLADRLILKA